MQADEVLRALCEECAALVDEPDPGPMIRAAVREALVRMYGEGATDEGAMELLRQIEFAADRIETAGTAELIELLRQRRRAGRRRAALRSGIDLKLRTTPPR